MEEMLSVTLRKDEYDDRLCGGMAAPSSLDEDILKRLVKLGQLKRSEAILG